jgi:hypothetical protein
MNVATVDPTSGNTAIKIVRLILEVTFVRSN